jgi:hypothetical protein
MQIALGIVSTLLVVLCVLVGWLWRRLRDLRDDFMTCDRYRFQDTRRFERTFQAILKSLEATHSANAAMLGSINATRSILETYVEGF